MCESEANTVDEIVKATRNSEMRQETGSIEHISKLHERLANNVENETNLGDKINLVKEINNSGYIGDVNGDIRIEKTECFVNELMVRGEKNGDEKRNVESTRRKEVNDKHTDDVRAHKVTPKNNGGIENNANWTFKLTSLLTKQKRLKKKQLRCLNQKLFVVQKKSTMKKKILGKNEQTERIARKGQREENGSKSDPIKSKTLPNTNEFESEIKKSEVKRIPDTCCDTRNEGDKNTKCETNSKGKGNRKSSVNTNNENVQSVQCTPELGSPNKPQQSALMKKYISMLNTILSNNGNVEKAGVIYEPMLDNVGKSGLSFVEHLSETVERTEKKTFVKDWTESEKLTRKHNEVLVTSGNVGHTQEDLNHYNSSKEKDTGDEVLNEFNCDKRPGNRSKSLEELLEKYLSLVNDNKNRAHLNKHTTENRLRDIVPLKTDLVSLKNDREMTRNDQVLVNSVGRSNRDNSNQGTSIDQNAALHQNLIVNVSLNQDSCQNKWSNSTNPQQQQQRQGSDSFEHNGHIKGHSIFPSNEFNRACEVNGQQQVGGRTIDWAKKNKRRRYNLKKRMRKRLLNQFWSQEVLNPPPDFSHSHSLDSDLVATVESLLNLNVPPGGGSPTYPLRSGRDHLHSLLRQQCHSQPKRLQCPNQQCQHCVDDRLTHMASNCESGRQNGACKTFDMRQSRSNSCSAAPPPYRLERSGKPPLNRGSCAAIAASANDVQCCEACRAASLLRRLGSCLSVRETHHIPKAQPYN
uniref:Uncharacterized protein n=1 Tax=Cacopsylla melanoneura TaxID=428564 RepID=A0A8D8YVB4_9HEMI